MRVTGTILNKFEPVWNKGKNNKNYARHDFVLKQADGAELKCSKFFDFEQDWVGADVAFDANYNQQYDKYTVNGEIEVVNAEGTHNAQPAAASSPAAPKRRGRPAKASGSELKEENVGADLESVRADAQEVVNKSLAYAKSVLKEDASEDAVTTLVGVLHATMATLYIEKNKRERVGSWSK